MAVADDTSQDTVYRQGPSTVPLGGGGGVACVGEHVGKDVEGVTTLQVALPSPPAQSMLSTMAIPAMLVLFLHSSQSTMGTCRGVSGCRGITSISRSESEPWSPPVLPHPRWKVVYEHFCIHQFLFINFKNM